MKKKYYFFLLIILSVFSCGTDDSLISLDIETNPDFVTIAQNSEIEIFVLSNDFNIPSNGQLSLSSPTNGSALVKDSNNTPNNPSDDTIQYSANPNQVGSDSFQYTICNTSGNCKTETINITITGNSNVLFNLQNMPYQTLSEYQFFEGNLKDLNPEFGVTPYTLNSTLFTDYAKKKRFIWMPNNTKATYISDDESLNFPVGTILIKNFYYENVLPNNETRLIETRLMIRKNESWVFANYVWNSEQTEATLNLDGSYIDIQWQDDDEIKSLQYRIPAGAECHTCHKVMEISEPIGPKPRNLNLIYNYSNGSLNQLEKLVSLGYLENSLPNNIGALPDYKNTDISLDLRARAYLDINCAHCHSEETHCAYRPMRFDFSETEDFSKIGVCVDPDTDLGFNLGSIVEPGDARNSVLHFRLNSTEPSNRMPLLGRAAIHSEGVELIEEWINSLNNDCN
ncbi:hypothetical protein [uncultured Winogradskyella sp.]|uniref:Ig-like domain-containing protein n=1 Tax=uncultured Winogradskyella sp. TaxID=395353 RepID=UPI002635B81F|nr:hypothetical protein [uncultured Winogradskyella sp.]